MRLLTKFCLVSVCLLVSFKSVQGATIATFADPSSGGAYPLFSIDLVNDLITAVGWTTDSSTGLNLKYGLATYADTYLEMTPINYSGSINGGTTGSGTIKFFDDGSSVSGDDPIFQIDFDHAYINVYSLGASNVFSFLAENITFSGLLVGTAVGTPSDATEESFAFSFANQKAKINGDGFTASASFTSSAEGFVPEPATIGFLLVGTTFFCLRRRRVN